MKNNPILFSLILLVISLSGCKKVVNEPVPENLGIATLFYGTKLTNLENYNFDIQLKFLKINKRNTLNSYANSEFHEASTFSSDYSIKFKSKTVKQQQNISSYTHTILFNKNDHYYLKENVTGFFLQDYINAIKPKENQAKTIFTTFAFSDNNSSNIIFEDINLMQMFYTQTQTNDDNPPPIETNFNNTIQQINNVADRMINNPQVSDQKYITLFNLNRIENGLLDTLQSNNLKTKLLQAKIQLNIISASEQQNFHNLVHSSGGFECLNFPISYPDRIVKFGNERVNPANALLQNYHNILLGKTQTHELNFTIEKLDQTQPILDSNEIENLFIAIYYDSLEYQIPKIMIK